MIIKTTSGLPVSFVRTDGKSIYDKNGTEWVRNGDADNYRYRKACYQNVENGDRAMLAMVDLLRVVAGTEAMQTPTTLEEMREYVNTSPKYIRDRVADWPDQRLMEVIITADERNTTPEKILVKEVERMMEQEKRQEQERMEREQATEAHGKPTEAPKDRGPSRRVPRPRKQEGSVSVGLDGKEVLLTPKQLEFLERLSECPGWDKTGTTGEYIASEYAQELSDTMTPMAVGAVLTTLREKHILSTEKCRIGGVKCCKFKLTETGIKVYNKLAGKEEQK